MRISTRIFAIGICGAATLGIARLHAQTSGTSLWAPPAAGINAAKLPDLNGVHLGMTPDQALAVMKGLYPANLTTINSSKQADGKVWITSVNAINLQNCIGACDSMGFEVNYPPNAAQVVGLSRTIDSDPAKRPTADTVLASLRAKYGKELATHPSGSDIYTWAWDETGQPVVPQGPSNWSPADCASVSVSAPGSITVKDLLPQFTRDLCSRGVYLRVQIGSTTVQGTQVVSRISMSLGDKSMLTRDAIASQQALEDAQAAQKNQQMKAASQQAAPKL
jgi:hypothetical protein